jgi:4-hydroxybenzoate polyprenyltransferase
VSESWTETLRTLQRWRRARLAHALFVPGAAVVALASAVGQDPSWADALGRVGIAWSAVALLRLWDDLEDREADRRAHADGVWLADRVWLGDAAGRIALAVVVGLSAVALWAPAGFVALYAALLAFYRLRRSLLEPVLLLKYPVLVGLLRGSPPPPEWEGGAAMLLIYGGMLVDAGHRAFGAAACSLAALALGVAVADPVGGAVVVGVGLVVPCLALGPIAPRAGILAAIVVELLAFRLVTS